MIGRNVGAALKEKRDSSSVTIASCKFKSATNLISNNFSAAFQQKLNSLSLAIFSCVLERVTSMISTDGRVVLKEERDGGSLAANSCILKSQTNLLNSNIRVFSQDTLYSVGIAIMSCFLKIPCMSRIKDPISMQKSLDSVIVAVIGGVYKSISSAIYRDSGVLLQNKCNRVLVVNFSCV